MNYLYKSLDTPAVLVDLDKLEANIIEANNLAVNAGVKLRPHSKCHECAEIAKMQIKAGAIGISSSKLEEAEIMANAGITDIMIVHPFYGEHKLEKLKKLLSKPKLKLSVTVDMIEQAKDISHVGKELGINIPVHLKIDCGVQRFGALPGEPTLKMANELCKIPNIDFVGILSHESTHSERTIDGVERIANYAAATMSKMAKLLRKNGIQLKSVTLGATPTLRLLPKLKSFPEITEYHPGMYIFGDIMYVSNFAMAESKCSLIVLTSVISTPPSLPSRAIIDAGGKTFTPDPLIHLREEHGYFWKDRPSYGRIKGRPDLWFGRLAAEVGCLYFTDPSKEAILGERFEIIPNNASMTMSIHDEIYGVRNGIIEKVIKVTGRGKGN